MKSDYEIRVLKELKKGKSNPSEIARRIRIPVWIVEMIIKRYEDDQEKREYEILHDKKRFKLSKNSVRMFLDVLIIYIFLKILFELMR